MNLLENIEDFDEESQKLLRGYAARGSIIQFSEMEKGIYGKGRDPFEGIRINGDDPDYRSGFHDFANTPLGYSYLTDNPVSVFPSTGVNKKGEKGIEYYAEVLPCKNGSEVYRSYEGNARKNQALFLFYEKPDATKSNFSGPFYIAKMGDYFKDLFKMFPKPLPSKINGKPFKDITSMEDEAAYLAQLAYTYEKDKIDATAVYQALMREFKVRTGVTQFDEVLGSISEIPANAIGWCADKLENLKPTEKNYNPESKEYTPIIPVLGAPVPVNMNKAAQFFENLGDNPFVQGAEAAFAKVWAIVEQTAGRVKEVSTDHLPDAFKKLVNKITAIIDNIKILLTDAKDDLAEMAKQGIEMLKLANAFYCGVVSGLVSLVQCLLYILEFLLQPTHTFSYEQYLKRRDLQEKAEDVLDWIAENGPKFLQGIKDLFKGSSHLSASDMESVLDKMKSYFGNVSRYTVAFYTGVLSFEVLINILLLIFTDGAGTVVKGETYVAKLWSLVKVLTKETASVATAGISDILLFLGKFVLRFAKACAKGFRGFIKFIEELLQGAKNGAKAEDLAEDVQEIEAVILKGRKAAEGAGANSYRKLSKAYDDIGKLKNVKRFENEIRSLEYEAAKIFDDKGNELSGLITQKRLDDVEFSKEVMRDAEELVGKGNLVITHNHPKSSSISYVDIEMFVANDLKELRAVTKEQKAFCLQKKGELPSWEEYKNVIKANALIRHNEKNAQLINTMRKITNKESQSFINANNKLKQLYADELLYQLRDVIKYTRYQ